MAAAKLPPCPNGKKHTWTHVRNVTLTTSNIGIRGTRVDIRFRGEYRCECGVKKLGRSV